VDVHSSLEFVGLHWNILEDIDRLSLRSLAASTTSLIDRENRYGFQQACQKPLFERPCKSLCSLERMSANLAGQKRCLFELSQAEL
jgi:hypothetical protein